MWTSESERLGFKQCTPVGYALVTASFLLLVGGAVALLGLIAVILSQAFSDTGVRPGSLPLLSIPVASMAVGWMCHRLGWSLARRRGFVYDYPSATCRWTGMPPPRGS